VNKIKLSVLTILLAVVLLVGLMLVMQPAPQPVSASGASWPQTINTASIAADTTWNARQWNWSGNEATTAEVWYSIDQGTTNTITLYLDASPDNSLWKTGYATVVSANEADATSYTTATIVGRYYRIRADVTNTNTITPTIKVILK
jgi:hypothetical protein